MIGLPPTVTRELFERVVKHRLAMYHPDLYPEELKQWASSRMVKINNAADVIRKWMTEKEKGLAGFGLRIFRR